MSVRKETRRRKDGSVREFYMVDVKVTRPDGEVIRVRKVSPVATARAAKAYERELREAILAAEVGPEAGEGAEVQAPPKPPPVPTLAEFVPEFMRFQASPSASRRGANKPGELREKQRILDNHLLPAFGHLRLDEITARMIDDYVAEKAARGRLSRRFRRPVGKPLAPATVANHLIVLRRILSVAQRWELLDRVPRITCPRADNHRLDFLSFDEADRIVAAADERWRTFLVVALRTGLRLGELRGLRRCDVYLDEGYLRVEQTLTKTGVGTPKSGKARTVELGPDAIAKLRRHLQVSTVGELVFCRRDGSAIGEQEAYRAVKRAAKHAGIRCEVHPHMLRHTFASHCALRGIPLLAVKDWLGHSALSMTERYAHLARGDRMTLIRMLEW